MHSRVERVTLVQLMIFTNLERVRLLTLLYSCFSRLLVQALLIIEKHFKINVCNSNYTDAKLLHVALHTSSHSKQMQKAKVQGMARGVPTTRAHGLTLASCLMCVHTTKKSAVITSEGGLTFYLSGKGGDASQKLPFVNLAKGAIELCDSQTNKNNSSFVSQDLHRYCMAMRRIKNEKA